MRSRKIGSIDQGAEDPERQIWERKFVSAEVSKGGRLGSVRSVSANRMTGGRLGERKIGISMSGRSGN